MKTLLKWAFIGVIALIGFAIIGAVFGGDETTDSASQSSSASRSTTRPTTKPSGSNTKATAQPAKKPTKATAQPATNDFSPAIADEGDFTFSYAKPSTKKLRAIQTTLQEGEVLETLATELNGLLVLPYDVNLTTAQCDEENAYYDPEAKEITLCYELISYFYDLFGQETNDQDKVEDQVVNATLFTFFHELGHALIDVYELPTTGREEDAVDQLSTFILTDGTKEGDQVALDGAQWFYLSAQGSEVDEEMFSDEHSLDQQRFYNIACWTYGQNPAIHKDLVKKKLLPKDRAEQCEDEYNQMAQSWATLLAPYVKE